MKYKSGFDLLGLPNFLKFGIELEAINVKTRGRNSLYTGESADYIKSKKWHMATKFEEKLVSQGGAELVSPILKDNLQDWQSIYDMCTHMKKYPNKEATEVGCDDRCGLHVHFDSDCLTKNPEIMKNFLKIYAESEEILYKMCNGINSPTRPYAINKNFKGLNIISSLWRDGVAAPTGKKILEHINKGTLKVSFKKFGTLKRKISKLKVDERRYVGLNLTNIGNSDKNTIEFRMANGTLDYETIKQTVFLYASLINTSIQVTNNPEKYLKQLEEFYKTDVSEEQKASNFLSLIIEEPKDRKIYMERWNSVRNDSVYRNNNRKGFAQNRFKREEFKNIYQRTPSDLVHQAYLYIKSRLVKTNEKKEIQYDR